MEQENEFETGGTRIADEFLGEFEKRFRALARKAKRIGVEPPSFRFGEKGVSPILTNRQKDLDVQNRRAQIPAVDWLANPDQPRYRWTTVHVSGEAPRLPGWKFLGIVEPSKVEGVNRIQGLPGEDLSDFREVAMDCDHCGVNRHRARVAVIRDEESGQEFQIGMSCVRDFLGGNSHPETVARWAWSLFAFPSSLAGLSVGSGSTVLLPLMEVLGRASRRIAVDGKFISAAKAREDDWLVSTRDAVLRVWDKRHLDEFSDLMPKVEDFALASKVCEWVREMSTDPVVNRDQYLLNLRLAFESPWIECKEVGIVVSAFVAYHRAMTQETFKREEEERKSSASPIPETDDRFLVEGEIVRAKWKDTDFGQVLKITIQHEDGWRVWGSCPSKFDAEELVGKSMRFMARVTVAEEDDTFGFFKRPTKPELLEVSR